MAKKNKFLEEDQTSAIDLVKAECERLVNEEGFSADHDDMVNGAEQLAGAAASYIIPAKFRRPVEIAPSVWPWENQWWKPAKEGEDVEGNQERIRELVKGAALAIKEIERLQRFDAGTNFVPETEE